MRRSYTKLLRGIDRREFLALGGAALLSACSKSPNGAATDAEADGLKPPNIIVYLADTLRADHLGCYGYGVPTSPRLDAFASRGVLFERCYSQAPWTKPSIASMFTGLLPSVHQAVLSSRSIETGGPLRVQTLRDSFVTLAEALKGLGYHTAHYLSNPHIQHEFGFGQGFDHYYYESSHDTAAQIDSVVAWISKEAREPFFVFVHEIDPHGPYEPYDATVRHLFGMGLEESTKGLSDADTEQIDALRLYYLARVDKKEAKRPDLLGLSASGRDHLKRMYDGEILELDYEFNRLLEFLDESGRFERTITAFTSDHGEAFGEHGHYFHGRSLHDEEIHVPLIVAGGGLPAGARVTQPVAAYDLYPSLVTLAGGRSPEYVQARTLFDARGAVDVAADRPVFVDRDYFLAGAGDFPEPKDWESAMILGDVKLISYDHGQRVAAYDLASDPGETINLLADGVSENLKPMLEKFHAARAEHLELSRSFGETVWTEGTQALEDELGAIGYMQK